MSAQTVRELFDQAFELPRAQWRQFLEGATSDTHVREQVLRLLETASEETDFLQRPAIASSEPARVQTGRRLGPYVIETEIGHGGMGVVYRATRADDAFHKTVAIKAVSLGVPGESFRRERQILANLEHPNIARMLDGGATDDGVLYLVMELVDGERLDVYAHRKQLSTKDRIRLLLPVCEAVSYAHRNLVVHRDLKPANILVTPDGTPKLLDFGVAKVFTPGASEVGNETRTFAMTIDYASPEQLRGQSVTTVSDVYSLGIVAYELLTGGKRPYRTTSEDSVTARVRAILEDEPERPQNLGGELGNILMKALAKEPELRYPSVEQLRADLVAHLAGRPVWAQAGGYWYRARKNLRRHWLPIGAAAAILVTSTVGAAAFLQQARVAEDRRRLAEDASKRAQSLLADKERLLSQQDALFKEQVRLRDQAQVEAKAAQEQRVIADSRFQRSQRLANSLLFEVHDAIDNTQGSAAVRTRIIKQTLPELEGLLREAPGDKSTRRSVAAAYERLGDLAGGIRGEGGHGMAAGLEYFSKAVALIRDDAELPPERKAIVLMKTGVLEFKAGRGNVAEELLSEAERTSSRSDGRDPRLPAIRLELLYNFCQVRSISGHPKASITCQAAADQMASATTAKLTTVEARQQRMEGFFQLAVGAQRRNELTSALSLIRAGLEESTRLMKEFPDRADVKRSHGMMLVQQANWIRTLGGNGAVDAYAEALKICRVVRAADPNHGSLGMTHGTAAMQYAMALHKVNRDAEGRRAAIESIDVFDELLNVRKPGWEEYNNYAQELLNCPYPDLCEVPKARRFAEIAVKLPGGSNAFVVDTLATAYFRSGDKPKAADTARKAMAMAAMMPKAVREAVEAHLRQYEAALAGN